MVVRWTFFDPVLDVTVTLPINPDSGGSPEYNKTVSSQRTTAGVALIYEGADEPQPLEWSGTLITEEHYNLYVTWFQKRRQIKLTDDLGRVFWIYITSFKPKRVRYGTQFWRHNYAVSALILDVA